MGKSKREITIHPCILDNQNKKIKEVITMISEKDSLNACDIQAVRILIEVYDSLSNPIQENQKLHQGECNNNNHSEELQ